MDEWKELLESWRQITSFRTFDPAPKSLIAEAKRALGWMPDALLSLYQVTNGLTAEWFRILPIENPEDIKRTWDGIKRGNDFSRTKHLGADASLLDRFLVFAEVGPGQCAAFDKRDGTIWYEESAQLHQTDFTLEDFIDASLREVAESGRPT